MVPPLDRLGTGTTNLVRSNFSCEVWSKTVLHFSGPRLYGEITKVGTRKARPIGPRMPPDPGTALMSGTVTYSPGVPGYGLSFACAGSQRSLLPLFHAVCMVIQSWPGSLTHSPSRRGSKPRRCWRRRPWRKIDDGTFRRQGCCLPGAPFREGPAPTSGDHGMVAAAIVIANLLRQFHRGHVVSAMRRNSWTFRPHWRPDGREGCRVLS